MTISHRTDFSRPRQGRSIHRHLVVYAVCLSFAGSVGCGARNPAKPVAPAAAPTDVGQALQTAVTARDWQTALDLSQQAMISSPNDPDVLTNAAIANAQTGKRVEAAQLLVEAVAATDYSTEGGRVENAVAALMDVGHLYDAIALLQDVVRINPEAATYRRRLVGFLGEAQLTENVAEHMKALIQQRQFDLPLLLATTETSSRRFSGRTIEFLLQRNPEDLRPKLGEARQFLDRRDARSAEEVLRNILRRHPDFAPAHAMLGSVLVSQGKSESLTAWLEVAPKGSSEFSGYWVGLGDLALSAGRSEEAVRGFGEATRRAPNESGIWARFGAALRRWQSENPSSDPIDVAKVAAGAVSRQSKLLELRDQFASFKGDGQKSQTLAVEVAKTLSDLGRLWESEAWLAIATTLGDDPSLELKPYRQQVLRKLETNRDWQSNRGQPELAFDLTRFQLPDRLLESLEREEFSAGRVLLTDAKDVRMDDVASSLGLSFLGRVGDQVEGPRIPITQTLGCGGGVIDFDLDDRQDLVFAAAGGRIRSRDSDPGALFRNVGQFANVSIRADFADTGYSQGIVVGDYNDDGFADMLVLNLGPNRLFRNNGDGTFANVSLLLGEQGDGQWSTSGAILDLNGDGLNDIFIVNYCDSRDPLEQPCFDSAGQQINCYPLEYRAGRDQILAGSDDGTFIDRSSQWIGDATLGRGLGIIAGKLDGRQQCVYVVSDASPNTFYVWQADGQRMVDQGIASGLAVDAQSLDQGSMGIASSDFDHDGDLDFYVTGFANEYNILYEQQSSGFWSDRTAARGLVDDTLRSVAFGTEAIDLDNDGVDEIAVTNGHVSVLNPPHPSFRQPFQLFRQNTAGGFDLVGLSQWSSYFQSPHVGRCLFSGDLDGDGMCDAIVTHATEPVALLANRSSRLNHRLTIRLIDNELCRDAVGATLDFEIGDPSRPTIRRLFQLSGHGYLGSNQQILWAGTGSEVGVRNVKVTWPDGYQQSIGDLDSDAAYILVRDEQPFLQRRYRH